MDDSLNIKPSLEISYKEFVAVLRRWEAFVWPELKKMPEAVPAIIPEESMCHQTNADVEVTSNVRLSELAEALWRSLEAGAKEVHRIHNETFAKDQVEFFVDLYSSADKLIPVDGIYGMLRSRHPTVEHPMELFIKLTHVTQREAAD